MNTHAGELKEVRASSKVPESIPLPTHACGPTGHALRTTCQEAFLITASESIANTVDALFPICEPHVLYEFVQDLCQAQESQGGVGDRTFAHTTLTATCLLCVAIGLHFSKLPQTDTTTCDKAIAALQRQAWSPWTNIEKDIFMSFGTAGRHVAHIPSRRELGNAGTALQSNSLGASWLFAVCTGKSDYIDFSEHMNWQWRRRIISRSSRSWKSWAVRSSL